MRKAPKMKAAVKQAKSDLKMPSARMDRMSPAKDAMPAIGLTPAGMGKDRATKSRETKGRSGLKLGGLPKADRLAPAKPMSGRAKKLTKVKF